MKESYLWFSNSGEVQTVVDNNSSPDMTPMETIMSLKEVRSSRGKIARSLGHIEPSDILCRQVIYSKAGIRVWCPHLQEAPDSPYNYYFQITALNTFQKLLTTGT